MLCLAMPVVPQFGVILRQASFFALVEYHKSTLTRHILCLGTGPVSATFGSRPGGSSQFRYPAELSLCKKLAFLSLTSN